MKGHRLWYQKLQPEFGGKPVHGVNGFVLTYFTAMCECGELFHGWQRIESVRNRHRAHMAVAKGGQP